MYARDLMLWLHERLAELRAFEETQKRFESLRGYALVPRGRENAGVRLSNEQIARAVLGFVHPLPGFAGHASLCLGDLRPVGGAEASFRKEPTLRDAVAALIGTGDENSDLLRLTLSVEREFNGEEYVATFHYRERDQRRVVSFISKNLREVVRPGAEETYDHERLHKLSAAQRSFGSRFFQDLSRSVSISRDLDLPLKTDWREYKSEREKTEFHRRLEARPSSRFLNLRVDAQVMWPKEPTRIQFDGHHLILFPKTKDHSHSISVDLNHEGLSADEARSLINRMLSVMSWCDDQPASLHEGWSGNPVPMPVPRHDLVFSTMHEWHFNRAPPDDEQLKRCLAFYRDGLNAFSVGLASHAVLSFFRVLETKLKDKPRAIKWVDGAFEACKPSILESEPDYEAERQSKGLGHGEYVYKWGRVSTAHAARDALSDNDGAGEIRRLLNVGRVLQRLARHFIKHEFKFSNSYLTDESN